MGHPKVSGGDVLEVVTWVNRLTAKEYQRRKSWLRKLTDPAFNPDQLKLDWPFKDQRPLKWGWTIEREGRKSTTPIDISMLEAVPFHENGERWVSGEEMLRRASDAHCAELSMHDVEDILEQADKLPEELRGKVLVFTDTILVGGHGRRLVACLFWRDGRWQLGWDYLGIGFDRADQFVRLRLPEAQSLSEASK